MTMFLSCLMAGAQTEGDVQQVFFRVGSASLNAEAVPQSLIDSARAVCGRREKYMVLGVASPEGGQRVNNRLAMRRAKAIVSQLTRLTGLPDTMFLMRTKVADMWMLRQLAEQDQNLPEKERVMALLEANGPTASTLLKLRRLGDGTPYLYIKDKLFPYLRVSVTSDKDLEDFQPDLAGAFQPQVVNRDYQAYKTGLANQTEPEGRSAVTQSKQSRHLSSHGGGDLGEKRRDGDSVKVDSASSGGPSADEEEAAMLELKKMRPEEKESTSMLPFWLAIFGIMLVMLLLAFFVKWRSTRRLEEILAETQGEVAQKNQQLKNAENLLKQKEEQLAQANSQLEALRENLDRIKKEKSGLYNDGEALYNHLLIGGVTYEWTNEQVQTLIEYYKLQNYPLMHSLETEYDKLPLNHILFEILVDMGKSDSEIQRMMNISQTTIRSYRFRIKNKKL